MLPLLILKPNHHRALLHFSDSYYRALRYAPARLGRGTCLMSI
jgi:hypothetical protein